MKDRRLMKPQGLLGPGSNCRENTTEISVSSKLGKGKLYGQMIAPPKFPGRGCPLWAEPAGEIFMQEVHWEGILEE